VNRAKKYTAAKWDFGIVLALYFYITKIGITSTQNLSQVSGLGKFKSLFLASDSIIYKKRRRQFE
jgi:hypothetical protein